MKIYLISYDLNGRDETSADYKRLIKAIAEKAGEGHYVKALYSQWFVETTASKGEWDSYLKEAMDANDNRMIIQLTHSPVGRYKASAVNWIEARLG